MNRIDHLLAIVAEECNEVGQRATKAMRFGLDETQPGYSFTNAERIMHELADLMGVIEMLQSEGHLPALERIRVDAKKPRVEKYLRYSAEVGRLDGGSRS